MNDVECAVELAGGAGDVLKRVRAQALERGIGGRELKDLGDRAAQDHLSSGLARLRPNDAVLSEEAEDDGGRVSHQRVWIIDPLDGTREYSEHRDDWAVHVALWEAGRLSAGAVALPGLGTVLDSGPHGQAAGAAPGEPIRIAVSRTRAPAVVEQVARRLCATLVPMGSAGYKICAVIRGEVDAYIHAGGQYEWDSAAPVAVARARGFHTSRIDGTPLLYNRPDPYLPDLVVCGPHLAQRILEAIAEGDLP
ncbi:3'(2'),5'-bisphosphate nucleotidase CysQ [Paeniglutamicibacter cryotolerans]|uniref:3'(2'),5-bisphosphonucleoside 3'(2')-phosphohydrolase n=1 Tax=Paeniglutamicibacter cryotolerans TaxID=670079 RepID=A0A839QVH1_9MICC|nr:3'(2'),5'-bisphosphate nucleotidase CysQ [Paeniglutamicibacter cryotolerans]MBB2996001.1 3'(2'), 5'-bisphosphate nucleotidase [Paeniglutamicibacter cryotolerans]